MIRATHRALRSLDHSLPSHRVLSPSLLYPHVTKRAASLSSIHRGLRDTERVRFGGERRDRGAASSTGRSEDVFGSKFAARRDTGLTGRALTGAGSSRQKHKLQKKLDRKEEERANGPDKKTRRKRFLDPESSFGKQSLVYKLKYGPLKDMADNLKIQEFVKPNRSFRSLRRGGETDRRDTRDELRGKEGRQEQLDRPSTREPRQLEGRSTREPRQLEGRSTREPRQLEGRSMREPRQLDGRSMREPRQSPVRNSQGRDIGETMEAFPTRKRMMPMTIKYTTAASQFLYGRSVVKSALERGRRKLYHLYIYGGENRIDSKEDAAMERLAKSMGVPITIVPQADQRLMDKMSMGRPHNGFVLETSPLPNIPVRSLGRLEESPTRMGFHVERDYQTKEEEAINGKDTFLPRSSDVTPKPFVLLLNEIMDPGNLGGLLRTASYLGVDAVGITNRSTSTLTPVVLKSAAGAVEEVSIFSVDDPVKFIEDSGKAGWKSYAAVAPPEKKLASRHAGKFVTTEMVEKDRPLDKDPCILILGNEGFGLSKPIKVSSDYELSVPRFVTGSCVDSLNVSVAAGLLCHAFVREPLPEPASPPRQQEERLPEASEETLY